MLLPAAGSLRAACHKFRIVLTIFGSASDCPATQVLVWDARGALGSRWATEQRISSAGKHLKLYRSRVTIPSRPLCGDCCRSQRCCPFGEMLIKHNFFGRVDRHESRAVQIRTNMSHRNPVTGRHVIYHYRSDIQPLNVSELLTRKQVQSY